jgi:hypothetical protein
VFAIRFKVEILGLLLCTICIVGSLMYIHRIMACFLHLLVCIDHLVSYVVQGFSHMPLTLLLAMIEMICMTCDASL